MFMLTFLLIIKYDSESGFFDSFEENIITFELFKEILLDASDSEILNAWFKLSKEFKNSWEIKRIKTLLKNNKISFDKENEYEIRKLYSNFMSEKTKISTLKKHKTMSKNGDITEQYKISGKKSRLTFLKHLEESGKTENEFYKITSEKSMDAKIRKFGSKENLSKFYKQKTFELAANFCNVILDENTPIDVIRNCVKIFLKNKKMYNYNSEKWKITHLRNMGLETDNKTTEEINKLYTEYLSKRYQLKDITNNGYKRTKKGYYIFNSKQELRNFFYRSSWEENFLLYLDNFSIENGGKFFIPERIEFVFENIKRHYYPDIGFEFGDKKYVFEIKPKKCTNEAINIAKFTFAKIKHDKLFFVVTENELNENFIKEIIT